MNERLVGTVVYGVRAPIINQGDDIAKISADCILKCHEAGVFEVRDRDVFTLTESVVARAQGNYISVDDIRRDAQHKFNQGEKIEHLGVVFPILSRNRFSMILKGLAQASKKVTVQLSYPSDEVGNHIITPEELAEKGVNPYTDVFTYDEWIELFGHNEHQFTGINYLDYYSEIVTGEGAEVEIILANQVSEIVNHTDHILLSDIHSRSLNEKALQRLDQPGLKVLTLADILNEPSQEHGYNETYGLLGSNKASETTLKLFPRDNQQVVDAIQAYVKEALGKTIEVMVYGDGAFKDPVGKIWELADPVVSPAFTEGLAGRPNELKLKYLVDNEYADLSEADQRLAVQQAIQNKQAIQDSMASEGTTPRQIPDLIGSLSDLVSGSGDKGTPFVYIQGYFDNFTSN
ncbi:F420-0--gamma-glutamyl ligase [Falseniella ignava]|uniref:F420-0--gamma-glutamyl ligase n=1 Tax=Falseniella ignava TaxID=137730 RepID=A0A2I1JWZ9_9LACT|nr:coenzyme F420-0:L-glutamate ligase [Falseniella ignava]PKY87906.1 F420-0--gamma-glutamyl ligase [Falseniella ignava]